MMKLLIVEPEATGHRMVLYVRLIVQSARALGWRLGLLTTKSALAHPALKVALEDSMDFINIHLMPETGKSHKTSSTRLLGQQIRYFRAFRAGFRAISADDRPDHIVVPNLDYLDKAMALAGSPFGMTPFSGVLMSVKFHRKAMRIGPASRNDYVYSVLFSRLLAIKSLQHLMVVDEVFAEYVQQWPERRAGKVRFIPEAAEQVRAMPTRSARATLGISTQCFVILVYGSLTMRKGIVELLQAVGGSPSDGIVVLLVGTPDQRIREFLNRPLVGKMRGRGQLVEVFGFQDRAGEARVFGAADVVWLGYVAPFFGSSGVLYQAGSVRLPVITPQSGLLGWLNERYEVGLRCDPRNPESVEEKIVALKENPKKAKKYGEKNWDLAKRHMSNRFGNTICQEIEQKCKSTR